MENGGIQNGVEASSMIKVVCRNTNGRVYYFNRKLINDCPVHMPKIMMIFKVSLATIWCHHGSDSQ